MIRITVNANNFALILINNAANVFLYFFTDRLVNQTFTGFYSKNKMSITLIKSIGHIENICLTNIIRIVEISKGGTATRRMMGTFSTPCAVAHGYKRISATRFPIFHRFTVKPHEGVNGQLGFKIPI